MTQPAIFAALALAVAVNTWPIAAGAEGEPETATQAPAAAESDDSVNSAVERDAGTGLAPDAKQDPALADAVVSVIDETPVTLGELIAIRQTLPEQYQNLPDEVLLKALLEQVTDQQLLANAALAAGLDKRKAFVLAIRNQRRAVLADLFMAEEVLRRIDEDTVNDAYQKRILDEPAVTEVRAAHILVEDKTLAEEIKAKLDAGADFASMAAKFGTDGTAQRGGDLGFFVRKQMVPQFADAAFAMKPGEISAPVQTPFGWHVIKLEERRDRPKPKLDAIRANLIKDLTDETTKAILEELRAAATIKAPENTVSPATIRNDDLILEQSK